MRGRDGLWLGVRCRPLGPRSAPASCSCPLPRGLSNITAGRTQHSDPHNCPRLRDSFPQVPSQRKWDGQALRLPTIPGSGAP